MTVFYGWRAVDISECISKVAELVRKKEAELKINHMYPLSCSQSTVYANGAYSHLVTIIYEYRGAE